ncbi:MAG: abhydrolase domain-containing 18 [Acidobacteria bacterium]|nr:abhydrolase domain-containing 18 [Acidobacteriota bacterium]
MIARLFHAWERRLVAVTTDRVVRPFDWGLDWLPDAARTESPAESLRAWAAAATAGSERFYSAPPAEGFRFDGHLLDYPSAVVTPHPENNVVRARYFAAERLRAAARGAARRAVVVLPQWNADAGAHVGLSRLIARFGISALRLSLPYHDTRMPPELHRADYIVSANIGRTLQVCRQAVLDARRAVDWLRTRGYQRIGILGTSLGSCLALLTAAHDRRITAAALNHISPYFADVVWEGLSTAHVREGLDGSVDLSLLRDLWMPISPAPYVERMRGKRVLLVYARYDHSFPVRLSRELVADFRRRGLDPEVFVLPCGHYSTGIAPFSWLDGYALIRFLARRV